MIGLEVKRDVIWWDRMALATVYEKISNIPLSVDSDQAL